MKCNKGSYIEKISCDVGLCVPDWLCSEWDKCANGTSTRRCIDLNECLESGVKPVEVKACSVYEDCTPYVECTNYGVCEYKNKIEDIFNGKINLKGTKERSCVDLNGCFEKYTDTKMCVSSMNVNLKEEFICGEKILSAYDNNGTRIVGIDLEAWAKNRLNIQFSQSLPGNCGSCYNGIKDENETEVDCGGDCVECKTEIKYLDWLIWLLIVLILITLMLILWLLRKNNVKKIRRLIKKGKIALSKKNNARALAVWRKIKRLYEKLDDAEKKIVHNEVHEYYLLVKKMDGSKKDEKADGKNNEREVKKKEKNNNHDAKSNTIKGKSGKWHHRVLSKFRKGKLKHANKKGVVMIDHKFVEQLKEKVKGKDVRGKWIKIR